jgi:EF hand
MRLLITLSAAALVSSVAAAADQPPRNSQDKPVSSVEAKFKALDRNGDAEISKAEAKADGSIAVQFASIDLNTNGFISKAEYTAYEQTKPQPSERAPLDQR